MRDSYDVVPVVRELSADTLTPIAAFAALAGPDDEAFLFESVERGENVGRYSFIGFDPRRSLSLDRTSVDPVGTLRRELVPLRVFPVPGLPPFFGGAVGFFGYGVSGWTERIPDSHPDRSGIPDAKLLFFDNVVVFDHVLQKLFVVANVFTADHDASLENAARRVDAAIERLAAVRLPPLKLDAPPDEVAFRSSHSREEFERIVRAAKEEITAGEIFQVVLSQRWEAEYPAGEDLTLYRCLRSINPSPYMFLLRTRECALVGASPEMLVRVTGDVAETRPIAGTRPRGASKEDDRNLEAALLADPKERAEHLMLVDLGRNDLGRVAEAGSVEVGSFCRVERYSHVLHLVTDVSAKLRDGATPVDALLSCFPAGTVSGAPKIRAMELIDQLEKVRRGPYAGAVAYAGFSGNLDSCITIRTIVLSGGRAWLQAGAGIVYDSDPSREYEETVAKAAAVRKAVGMALGVIRDSTVVGNVPAGGTSKN